MGKSLTRKIIEEHLISGQVTPGEEISLKIDQTLTQDATGTMAYLQLEAIEIPRVRTKLSVSYVDHNMLQTGFENADDHRFLQTIASKYGVYFSRPGNGICHQVHLERFSSPGDILLGSDSHTPTSGGAGMLAIGAGGLDVAVAMAGGPYYLPMPRIVGVHLRGQLQPWVAAKDIILEMLRRLTVRGGVGKIFEYFGDGVASLNTPGRSTVTNMGAELGATTSIFPSDERTREYFRAQQRESDWQPLEADANADYDEIIEIDLDKLGPMVARPQSPDAVVPIEKIEGTKLAQVCIGSCTNSSLYDLSIAAAILSNRKVNTSLSVTVTPGSRQVFTMISRTGALTQFIEAGARILESACGPCIGMGQSPPSGGAALRTFNRNFPGRSGTADDQVYLASPEVAAVSSLLGYIADPRKWGEQPLVQQPAEFAIDDALILPPASDGASAAVERGPNIKPLPVAQPLAETVRAPVLIKLGDNVSTDHILPGGSKVLPLRSNIPAISEYVLHYVDSEFPRKAKEAGSSIIVGGSNYGQGSSREHAAIAPMFLGVKAVLAKSYARMHHTNLINFGIVPLIFANENDYDRINLEDELEFPDLRHSLGGSEVTVRNLSQGLEFKARHNMSERQLEVLSEGGLLNHVKAHAG